MASTALSKPSPKGAEEKKNPLQNLSEREQRLLSLMAVNFCILAIAGGVYMFRQSQQKTRAEIEQYEKALDALQEFGPAYLAQQSQAASGEADEDARRFSAERLKKNNLKLTSFVATHASAVDLKVDNYDEDQLPLSTNKDGGPIITENQVKVDIKSAEMDKVVQLLDRIEESREPVIIKRINLRDIAREPGKVRANLVISTFVQKDQEG